MKLPRRRPAPAPTAKSIRTSWPTPGRPSPPAVRRPAQDALRHPQQRRTAQKNAAEARAGSIVGRHQASAPRPRPQDHIPEVAEGIGLPCIPEDHRRDEASLARSSGRPTIRGSCAAPLLLETHMGGDTPLPSHFLGRTPLRAVSRFEDHQTLAPAHLCELGSPHAPVPATPGAPPHGPPWSSTAGSKSPFVTPSASPSKPIEPGVPLRVCPGSFRRPCWTSKPS